MDQQNLNMALMVIALVSLPTIAVLIYLLKRKRREYNPAGPSEPASRAMRREFSGERVYSLALRGKFKRIFQGINLVAAVMPLVVLAILWTANVHRGISGSAAAPYFWLFVVAMFAWSVMTLWFLRSLMRHRQGTTISLSSAGVRYYAPHVGLFAAKDIFIPWDRIESVTPANRQHPSLIGVHSPDGAFTFDSLQAQEVRPFAVNGRFVAVESGNDLYHDLLEYAGWGARTAPAGIPVGAGV